MLLAEVEVWHTRPSVPTRRLALGHLFLPTDPAPGLGGLLLGAVVAAHIGGVDPDLVPDLHRLIDQVEKDQRVVQPRLRHRFQVDRHGLARSTHRLLSEADEISFRFDTHGTDLAQVLGAIYAVERLDVPHRRVIAPILHKATLWRGPVGPALINYLAGAQTTSLAALADPRAWALEILGFPPGAQMPSKREVMTQYRQRMMSVHPDHGGDRISAGTAILELNEARRILSAKVA
jgi:hypothetical protein